MMDLYIFYIIEIITLVIAAFVLVAGLIVRKGKNGDLDRVLQIALFVGLLSSVSLFAQFYANTWMADLAVRNIWLGAFLTAVLNCGKEFFALLIIIYWNMYVDYCTYKSYDHVRKKLKKTLLLVSVVSAVFTLIYMIVVALPFPDSMIIGVMTTFVIVSFGIQLLYVINAVWIVWSARKRRKPPTFLRLDLFLIPIAVGFIMYLFNITLGIHDVRNLCYAVAVLLTFLTLMRRGRYVDPATGFYNRTFLSSMNEYMEKNGYPNSIGVYFKAPESEGKLIPILDSLKPSDAEIFSFGKDEYLLMSGPQKESVIRLLIKSVNLKAAEEGCGFTVQTAYAIRGKDETPEAFTKRLSSDWKAVEQ